MLQIFQNFVVPDDIFVTCIDSAWKYFYIVKNTLVGYIKLNC